MRQLEPLAYDKGRAVERCAGCRARGQAATTAARTGKKGAYQGLRGDGRFPNVSLRRWRSRMSLKSGPYRNRSRYGCRSIRIRLTEVPVFNRWCVDWNSKSAYAHREMPTCSLPAFARFLAKALPRTLQPAKHRRLHKGHSGCSEKVERRAVALANPAPFSRAAQC